MFARQIVLFCSDLLGLLGKPSRKRVIFSAGNNAAMYPVASRAIVQLSRCCIGKLAEDTFVNLRLCAHLTVEHHRTNKQTIDDQSKQPREMVFDQNVIYAFRGLWFWYVTFTIEINTAIN